MVLCFSAVSIEISYFSYLILFEFFLSSCWCSWARGLFIFFTLSKNKLFVLLLFFYFFFFLIFMISFLLLTSGVFFVCFSFPNSFRWWVKLSIWDFSSFLRKACIAVRPSLCTLWWGSFHAFVPKLGFRSKYLEHFFFAISLIWV